MAIKINFAEDINAGQYSPFVELEYSVTNNTDKEIKGIQGILQIKDMFGEKIINLQYDLTTQNIPAEETISVSGYGVEVNRYIAEQMKLYDTSFDNLLFEYKFKQVIFADGSAIKE